MEESDKLCPTRASATATAASAAAATVAAVASVPAVAPTAALLPGARGRGTSCQHLSVAAQAEIGTKT